MIYKVYEILKACNCSLAYNKRPTLVGKDFVFDGTIDFSGIEDMDGYLNEGIAISYHFFNEEAENYEDGEETEVGGSLQVDLFAMERVDFVAIKKQIKQLLKANKFMGISSYDTRENIDGAGIITHVVITCNYLELEE